jgi:hypothetical protein
MIGMLFYGETKDSRQILFRGLILVAAKGLKLTPPSFFLNFSTIKKNPQQQKCQAPSKNGWCLALVLLARI